MYNILVPHYFGLCVWGDLYKHPEVHVFLFFMFARITSNIGDQLMGFDEVPEVCWPCSEPGRVVVRMEYGRLGHGNDGWGIWKLSHGISIRLCCIKRSREVLMNVLDVQCNSYVYFF